MRALNAFFAGILFAAGAACGDKKPPEAPAPPPVALTALTTPEAAITRAAHERGYLTRDPHATLAGASAVVWVHGGLVLRPLTGAAVAVAEDVRVPLGASELTLARLLRHTPTAAVAAAAKAPPMTWDEHFGLGPGSARCAAGASCDPEGRVMRWVEGGQLLTVTWDGPHPRSISAGGRPVAELRHDQSGLLEVRAAPLGTAAPSEAWPLRVSYVHGPSGRLESVDAGGVVTTYRYDDLGRLTGIARGEAVTRLDYDADHRIVALEGPGALVTRVTHASSPAAGLRADVSVSDALGAATRFTWSVPAGAAGASTSEVKATPTGAPERALLWVFDEAGRLLAHAAAGARTAFVYDGAGRLAEVRHPDGLVQRLERAPDGRLAAVVDGATRTAIALDERGNIASLERSPQDRETWTWASASDAAPRLVRIERASGRFEAWTFDALGRLARAEGSDGAVDELRYDQATGMVAAVRDERGGETSYAYDALGRPTAITRPDGSVERWTLDAAGRITTHVEPGGRTSTLEYDALDRPVRMSRDDGVSTWSWDAFGRALAETSPLGTTRYQWKGSDLTGIELPDGRVLTREHDAWGRLVVERASDGHRRELAWADPAEGGRLLRERVPGTMERRFTWDAEGRLARLEELGAAPGTTRDLHVTHKPDGSFEMKDALSGAAWTYRRTAEGAALLSSASTPTGAAESFVYDARGRLVEKTSSLGLGFSLAYDGLGRVLSTTSGSSGTLRMGWTPAGRLASLDAEGGLARRYEYDAAGRLTGVAEGASHWRLAYGAGPDPAEIVDPAGRRTTFTYDAHQRLASRTTPASGTDRFTYDAAGRLASEVRADGTTHAYTWDELGRLVRHDVAGTPVRALAWDDAGRLVLDESPQHRVRVAFDDSGRTRTTSDLGRSLTTLRTRDALGRTERLLVDGRVVASYLRRSDGLLTRVEGPTGFAVDVDHDAFGRRTGLRLPGGGALRYRYDAARRPVALEVTAKDGTIWSARFAYDRAGRLASETVGDRDLGFAYDDRGRLAALTLPDGTRRAYGWTDAGDLVRMGDGAIAHDEAGRPVAGGRTYDARGRLATRPEGWTLAYDATGRLATVMRGATSIAYEYDGDGRLLARSENGAPTMQLVWDGGDLLEERGPGAPIQHIPGELPGERLGFVAAGAPRYLVQAPDGSTLAVVDGEGRVLMTYLHEPFGTTLVADGSVPDPLHYRGRFTEPETGLVHHPMRWYDPAVGAFTAPDPAAGDAMDPATLHRYAYLVGDPVNHADPLGAEAFEWGPETCLKAVCELFQSDKIKAAWSVKGDYSFIGAIEKRGWVYDVWAKRIPGTDRVVTIFRDLNERAEGLFQGAGLADNVVLNPDGPRNLQLPGARPTISYTPAAPAAPAAGAAPATSGPGFISRAGATIREGLDQAKIGVQLYGKEITGTIGTLGGLSGTLGTSLGTLAALPGGGLIIAAGAALAGAVGYGAGTLIDKIPGVSAGAQILISSVMGYDKDQALADLKAQMENEGAKGREHRDKTIADNLAKDTMPPPPEPGVAGGTTNIGEPPRRDRDRPPSGEDAEVAPDAGEDDEDDEGDTGDDDEDDDERDATAEQDGTVPNILDKVAARRITVTFTHEQDASYGGFANIVRCTETLTFWNVGAMAPGYGGVTHKGKCVASLNNSTAESSGSGTFSGGPNGTITFASEDGSVEVKLSGGQTISIPDVGTRPLPADAFADWPKDL